MGVGAHALDELRGRPLRTQIPSGVLVGLAASSIAAACAIGIVVAARTTLWLLVFVAFGAFVVAAYNLELFGGAFHSDVWFAAAWGAFPVLTAYFVAAENLRVAAVAAAAFGFGSSLAQRSLSTQVRLVRRRVDGISGEVRLRTARCCRSTRSSSPGRPRRRSSARGGDDAPRGGAAALPAPPDDLR